MGLVTPVSAVPVSELGRVHFTGIGGAGMSGVARILLSRGVAVSGSDSAPSAQLDELAALGAVVTVGHAAANLGAADTLVVSSAIRPGNPELAAARQGGLRVLHRAAALACLMLGKQGIAVAGTHGKTTTTSMITTVLRGCGADPSYVIGGILAGTGLGAAAGSGTAFVAEADESDGSFLMLSPAAAVVTCVEADHLDNYPDLAQIKAAFRAFVSKITDDRTAGGGLLIACADDPGAAELAQLTRGDPDAGRAPRVVTYGTATSAAYRLTRVRPRGMATGLTIVGAAGTRAYESGPVDIEISVPGAHNALNAAAAFALTAELGFPAERIAAGLAAYGGAQRRMELKGEADGVRVVDSYAHHPTELAADLTAARDVADGGRVIALFQPHLFSRTRIFAAELGAALGQADEVLVLGIYAAREDPEPGVTGQLVASAVPGGLARFLPDRASAPAAIAGLAKPGDLVLTMGAGDVTALGPPILAALRERAGEPG
ncbi:MAG: UDP-N-acetylmuramate--L-alanine ligase [Streptosporangiaceae bacterium]